MELSDLRARIDEIDGQLIPLLEARMDVAADIAACKAARGLPVLDEAREAEKLDDVRRRCRPATAEGVADVFRAVMAASRAYQTALREGTDG